MGSIMFGDDRLSGTTRTWSHKAACAAIPSACRELGERGHCTARCTVKLKLAEMKGISAKRKKREMEDKKKKREMEGKRERE